ncbi:hypothetical protein ACO0K2_15065 [Undibacterium sp. MH2W]|uniref:hypothetical protein n=1 Tax=Undibacterium sp. MH2W TaxID=3413044 RepID=UPI003BF190CB
MKGATAPLDSRVRGSDGVWGAHVDLSGFVISVVRYYFRYLPLFSSSSLTPSSPLTLSVILPYPVVAHHSPSSSAQAEDPVRVSAFLPFQLTHSLKGAAAPLGSRLRGSDGVWGLRGRGLTA